MKNDYNFAVDRIDEIASKVQHAVNAEREDFSETQRLLSDLKIEIQAQLASKK